MISDAGTKSPRSEPDLAQATSLDQALVRGCLVQLGRPGLVREIDPKARIWEVAHDFVARLLGQLVARAKPRLRTRLRPILAPVSLAVWLLLLFGAYPAYHLYQYNATQRLLAREGVSIIQNDEGGHRLDYTNAREDAFVRFEPHLGPLAPINELDLVVRTNLNQLPSFDRRIDLRTLSIGVDTSQRRSGAQPKSQLTSLPPLDKLGALQSLEISSNDQLASIPALGAGRNLKELWIIENVSLEKIDGLDQLIVLETINLQSQNDELLTMAIEQLKGAPQLKRIALPFHAKAKGLGEVLNAKRRAAGREPVQVFYQ